MAEENPILSDVEQANEAVTRAFVQAWADRNCDQLMPLLAENVAYMVYEGGPTHVGHAAVEGAVRPFMAKFERADFKILRLNVIGDLVIHERVEDYYAPGGERDSHFHVVGLLRIKDGKIEAWRDYGIPGAEQIVGPLITQG